MARKKSVKPPLPVLKLKPEPAKPAVPEPEPGPPSAAEVQASIAASGSGGPEEIERVNDRWYEAYRDLHALWETQAGALDDANESCDQARKAANNVEALMDAVVDLLDHTERAPLDAIYPTILMAIKDRLQRELDSCTRMED